MQTAINIRTDWVALLAGLAIAAALVATWRVDGGSAAPPARVEIVTSPSAQIAINPDGITSEAQKLVPSSPGDGLRRTVEIRNATAEPLDLRVKAVTDRPELNGTLEVDVRAGARQVYGGPLAGLESGSQAFALDAGESLALSVLAWVPEGADSEDWAGRSVSVALELEPVGGGTAS